MVVRVLLLAVYALPEVTEGTDGWKGLREIPERRHTLVHICGWGVAFAVLFRGASVVGRRPGSAWAFISAFGWAGLGGARCKAVWGKPSPCRPEVHSVIVLFTGHLEGHLLRGNTIDPMNPAGPQAHCAVHMGVWGSAVCVCVQRERGVG